MTTSVSTRSPGTLNPTRQQLDELDALLQRMLELPVDKGEDAEAAEFEEAADEPPPPTPAPLPHHVPVSSAVRGSGARGTRPALPPVSYMVVETASPRPLPPASGFEPQPPTLTPRLVPVTPTPEVVEEEPHAFAPVTPPPPALTPVPESLPAIEATPAEGEMWVPLRSTWQPSAQTWQPLADSWHQANSGTPAPIVLPNPRPELPMPMVGAASRAAPEVRLGSPDLPAPVTGEAPAASTPITETRLSLSAEDAPVAVPRLLLPLLWFNQGFDACFAPLGPVGRWLCGRRGRQALGFIGLASLAIAVAIAVGAGMGWTW
jgi:hypothetical protein